METSKFALYAAEESKRTILGDLIKFTKGNWQRGSDKNLISPDQRFVAVMDTMTTGHLKWVDGKIVDHKMGLVVDGFRPVHRRDLDDYDSKSWKADENGDLVDPWQQTTLLVLVSPAEPHDLFTFSTSTEGGKSALNDLCMAHARTTENLGEYPVVTLKTGSYLHKIKSRGRIEVPVFEVVDRVEADRFNAIVAGARGGAGFIPTTLPASERLEIDGPPAPSAPLVEKYEGPDDGSDDGIEDIDFGP